MAQIRPFFGLNFKVGLGYFYLNWVLIKGISVKTDSTDEKALLKGLAQNDRKAVETIYKQYYNMVQSLIINNNGSSDDARDIFQEAVIVLYEKAKSGTFELNCQLKLICTRFAGDCGLKVATTAAVSFPILTVLENVPVEEEIEGHGQRNQSFI